MSPSEMPSTQGRGWGQRFAVAGRGVVIAVRGEASFIIHRVMTVLVVIVAALLRVSEIEWCLLIVCITIVLTAEMFNTAIERLARAITRDEHPEIRDALDIASGAVLVTSIGAAVIGAIVLGGSLLAWVSTVR